MIFHYFKHGRILPIIIEITCGNEKKIRGSSARVHSQEYQTSKERSYSIQVIGIEQANSFLK